MNLYRQIAICAALIFSCFNPSFGAGTVSCKSQPVEVGVISGQSDEQVIQRCPPQVVRTSIQSRLSDEKVFDAKKWCEERTGDTCTEIDLADFGAAGDGKTDDLSVLRDALYEAEIIHIPAGRFRLSNGFSIPDHVKVIYGDGVLVGGGAYGIVYQTRPLNGLRIEGLTFEYEPQTPTIFGPLYFDGGLFEDITVNRCRFIGSDTSSNGMLLVGKNDNKVRGFSVTNSEFIGIRRAAIEVLHRSDKSRGDSAVEGLVISGNKFLGPTGSALNERDFNPAISLSQKVYHPIIEGNAIRGYKWGIELAGTVGATVRDNVIESSHDSINSSDHSEGSVIEGNVLQAENRLQLMTDGDAKVANNTIYGSVHFIKSKNISFLQNKVAFDRKIAVWIDNSNEVDIHHNELESVPDIEVSAIRGYGALSDNSNSVWSNTVVASRGDAGSNTNGASVVFRENEFIIKKSN